MERLPTEIRINSRNDCKGKSPNRAGSGSRVYAHRIQVVVIRVLVGCS